MKKYKNIINFVIILIITALVLYFSLKDDYQNILNQIRNLPLIYILSSFCFVFLYYIFRSLSLHSIICMIEPNYSFKRTYELVLITQFFNAITPFSTGGQPFQIYHLKKDGIPITKGTNIIMQNFIVYQIALVILGIFALIYNSIFHIYKKIYILRHLVGLGFFINTLVIVFLFFIAFSENFSNLMLKILEFILGKRKDKEERLKKWNEYIASFHEGAKVLMEDKSKFMMNIFYNILALSILYLVPFFLLFGMGEVNINPTDVLVSSAYTMLIGAFVPIPGATGGIEYGYISFFGQFIKGPILNASMLLWRGITYYVGLIIGAITLALKKDVKE